MFLILREALDDVGDDIYVIDCMCANRAELVTKLTELRHIHGVEKSLFFEAVHSLNEVELNRDVNAEVQKMKDADAAEKGKHEEEEAVRLAKWKVDQEEQRKRRAAENEACERALYERLKAKYGK